MKLTRYENISLVKEGRQPPLRGLDSWYFGRGITSDGLEVINSKGDNAKVIQRLVAKGDGATGYIDHGLQNVCGAGASLIEYETIVTSLPTASGCLVSEYATTDNKRGWQIIIDSDVDIEVYIGKSDGTLKGSMAVSTIGLVDGDTLKVKVEASGSDLVTTVYVNGVSAGTDTLVGQNVIYSTGANLISFANRSGTGSNSDVGLANATLTINNILKLYCPFDGSAYDVSGNDYHGTIVGTVDMTQTVINTSGIYSYNLNGGFDLYYDDATGLVPLYVPYVNGSPVVASVAGYTKDSEHPQATKKINNVPDCAVLFTEDIMDKSNVTYWKASLRALPSYNITYPKKWDLNELTLDFISTHMESAIYNRLFVSDNESNFVVPFVKVGDLYVYGATGDTLNRGQNLLMYDSVKSDPRLIRIIKWIIGKGRKGI